MIFGRPLALDRFIKAHPPSWRVSPASRELASAYEGILPSSLLELWRRKGLGFYGDHQLALVDPRAWQSVLDSWMAATPFTVRRIPVAMTPFGTLLFYRKLAETAGDVAYVDPVSQKTGVLAPSLDGFFTTFLCEQKTLDSLMPPARLRAARQQCGALAPGEVYCADQLLAMQFVLTEKVNAIDMHHCLRSFPASPKRIAGIPAAATDALPIECFSPFAETSTNADLQPLAA